MDAAILLLLAMESHAGMIAAGKSSLPSAADLASLPTGLEKPIAFKLDRLELDIVALVVCDALVT